MKVIKEFVENYLYYFNELMKNRIALQNHSLIMTIGKTTMSVSKDSITALIDVYNKYANEEKIIYK